MAREHGIVLTLENHYKDGAWDYPEFAQKMDVFLELVEAVGDEDAFGINYDPSNAIVAGDNPIELLEAVKYRVVTMHASDRWLADGATLDQLRELDRHPSQGYAPFLKHGIIGQGLNDYDQIFQILADVDFKGWISIEDGQDPECGMEHLRDSAVFLRNMMAKYGLP
jgi:sugar phosphate isomerase/epimerase